ncbi:CST, telomere maintenance, complex subunit CTC1-domain-containing protein [Parasitella parasitica]|nr:CST, telomere maintenance, complex subunit CTC1-domain-containing protein [Parasitella parasitica]
MDVQNVHYPLGMVIGARVAFYSLIGKKKASTIEDFYFLADSTTFISVNDTNPSSSIIFMNPALVRTRLISSFLDPVLGRQDQTSKQIFKLYCYVNSIINLTLKWECKDCGSIVRNNDCYGMCEGASRNFSAQSFVQISDGTANANAAIDGERLVFRLLQLSPNQIDALKKLVLNHGQLSYGGWGVAQVTTMDDDEESLKLDTEKIQRNALYGFTLEDLCNNAKRAGQFFLYAQAEIKQNRKRQRDEEELDTTDNLVEMFKLRKFRISDNGSLLKTAELSKLKVKAVEIVFPDPRLVAYEMLDLLNENEMPSGSIPSLPVPLAVSNFE